jgi:predicted Zn-dependent peptidase
LTKKKSFLQIAKKSGKKFYRRSTLDNGVTLLTERARNFKSLSIGVWVKGGSRHETPSIAGMAHFLEHMMFKGTEKRSSLDIARDVDLCGGDFNAMTSREYTCFHITLPYHELDFALDLLTDILKNSKFDPVELERERMVIMQELAMTDESPEEYVHDVMFKKAYGSHPLGENIIGSAKTLKNTTRADLIDYFKRHYYSKNIIITMAGNVDHDAAARKLNRLLAGFKGKKKAVPAVCMRTPKFHEGIHVVKQESEQTHIAVACEAYPINHPNRLAVFLMNSFLGGTMSSALFQAIREEKGLAYTVYSSLAPFTDCGLLGMYVGTSPKHVGECLRLMREQVNLLQTQPLSEKDLAIAKNTLKSAVLMGGDSMENRMFALAKGEMFYDGPIADDEICRQIDEVTSEHILNVAKELFGRDKWLIVALGDAKASEIRKAFKA